MSRDEYHAEWWRQQPVREDLRLRDSLGRMRVRDIDGRPRRRLSLCGRLYVPRGAVSSGLHMLSADGREFARVFNIPLMMTLTALCCVATLYVFMYALLEASGSFPWLAWLLTPYWLLALVHKCYIDADARLAHTPLLLTTLLVSTELSSMGCVSVRFLTSSGAMQPTRRFLSALGIASSTSDLASFIGQAEDLDERSLHVFCIETAEDADAFLRRYAGRQCAQQLLVVDPAMWTDDERGRALRAYAAVAMDSGFAHKFFEVFGSKMSKLVHSRRS